MIPAMAMAASNISSTMEVAGRTDVMVCLNPFRGDSWGFRRVGNMSRPPNGDGGLDYMKGGSSPWGGLGGYPFTPGNVP
jgi:hypothetical protein